MNSKILQSLANLALWLDKHVSYKKHPILYNVTTIAFFILTFSIVLVLDLKDKILNILRIRTGI